MKKSGVYKITNTVNGNIYIGSAIDIAKRKRDHFWNLRKGTHCNDYLQKSFNKYGEDVFLFETLSTCLPEFCIELEQFYINIYSESGAVMYNICKTAGSVLGRKMSEETKAKIGYKNSKKRLTEDQKSHLREINLGKKQSAETIEKRRQKHIGKIMSDEAKLKISIGNKGKKKSEAHILAMKKASNTSAIVRKINQYDLEGNFIKQFESITKAINELNLQMSNLYKHFNGERKHVRGFTFKRVS